MNRSVFISILLTLLLVCSAVFVRAWHRKDSIPCFGTEAAFFGGNLTFSDLAGRLLPENR